MTLENRATAMRMRPRALLIAVAVLATIFAGPQTRSNASPCATIKVASTTAVNMAGLVVEFSDGTVKRYCISFDEETITGVDLLIRSGLPLRLQDYGGGSVAVCRIGPDGCDYPSQPCFCSCPNPSQACSFWGYYTLDGAGDWKFATGFGAGTREVRNGDVDGWRWGEHKTPNPPPPSTLASVCANGTPIGPAPTPKPSPTKKSGGGATKPAPEVSPKPGPTKTTATGSATPSGTTPQPTPTPSSSEDVAVAAGDETDAPSGPPPAGIALVLVAAAGLGLWGTRRLRAARRADPR